MPSPARARPLSIFRMVTITIVLSVLSLALGFASRFLRTYLEFGHVHYEALGSLVLLLLTSLFLAVYHRRHFRRPAALWFQIHTATLWWTFVLGWSIAHRRLWDDIIVFIGGWWLATVLVLGLLLLLIQTLLPVKLRQGPYCPACNYCLIGLAEFRCPECGRPFTLAELDITENDLHVAQTPLSPSANRD